MVFSSTGKIAANHHELVLEPETEPHHERTARSAMISMSGRDSCRGASAGARYWA
ncbi:hypothetical protein [Actinophytocola sp.]|uniref:hypothetical protein n=1 Tax=Actinophytocola sp. TaxID=1872138 RepID=UPI003D6C2350